MNKYHLVLWCTVGLTACSTTPDPSVVESQEPAQPVSVQFKVEKQLQEAETKWQHNKPTYYKYILQRTCFCPKEYNSPIEIWVLNGVVQKALLPQEQMPLPPVRMPEEALTIDHLFKLIHKAVDQKAAKIEVKYNMQYGYPMSIAIDWDKMMADEETYLTGTDLKPL